MITTNSRLPVGSIFYLLEHPGNVYRNLPKGQAEFVEHRLGNQYRGYVVTLGTHRMVATDPFDEYPGPCTICGKPLEFNNGLCGVCEARVNAETLDYSLL